MIRPKPDPQTATGAAWRSSVPSPPTAAVGAGHVNPAHYGDGSCCFTGRKSYFRADDLDDCSESVTATAASASGMVATSEAVPVEKEEEEDDDSARLSVELGHEHSRPQTPRSGKLFHYMASWALEKGKTLRKMTRTLACRPRRGPC